MLLKKEAQFFLTDESEDSALMPFDVEDDLVVLEDSDTPNDNVFEVKEESKEEEDKKDVDIKIVDPEVVVFEFEGALPGAPEAIEDPVLEVVEEEEKEAPKESKKKNDKWDWESKGATGFFEWVKEMFNKVPSHTGYDSAGLERAVSFLEKLDEEISRAMKSDLDGELDAHKIAEIRNRIDDGLEKLLDRLDKVKKNTKSKRRKKRSSLDQNEIVKEGQKITGVQGPFITVSMLIAGIVRTCINAEVSAGHDIEDSFNKLAKKYDLSDRERFEAINLLFDMGYPMRIDRGLIDEENTDQRSSENFDWAQQFNA